LATVEGTPSIRARKKAATYARILQIAHEMFFTRGYSAATLEDICAAVPISKRTLFRYFADKEALVFPNRDKRLGRFASLLEAADPSEPPFDMFRRVTGIFAAEYMKNRGQLLAQQKLIAESPELLAREREIDRDWEREIAKAFVLRLPARPSSERRATVLAGAMIGTVRATMRHWFARGGVDDLEALGHEALYFLERGFAVDA